MFSIFQKEILNALGQNRKLGFALKKYLVLLDIRYEQLRKATSLDLESPNMVRGIDYIRDPRLNKGLAFTIEERQALGIQGLIPADYKTQEEQLDICRVSVERYKDPLNKYIYLVELQERNERLFYLLLSTDLERYMPIVYTPTVGLACQKFGLTYKRPRGLFVTIHDKGHVYEILRNWPVQDVRAIVFTDGERILGLGDLGAFGMGIPVGKLALYTALAHIQPHQCLPITLDCGTDNQSLLEDPLYFGLRQKRVRGKEYDDFIDEFMAACIKCFGPNTLLQFEDFALVNATRLLHKYVDEYCTFNDDIQGTASVTVAGLFAATRITKKKIRENVFMILGAGSAATGISHLLVMHMVDQGMKKEDALKLIYLFDVDGLLTHKRQGGVPAHAKEYAQDLEPEKNFAKCVATYKPTCLIGCSTVGGAFNETILKQMAKNTERPIIFALSNPTSNAECTAQAAYDHTGGKCVFASGSPFPPVKYDGKEYRTGQGNNAYIFPGVALGVLESRSIRIPDMMFLVAARTLANFVSESDLNIGRIYPPLNDSTKISLTIAVDIANYAYDNGIATTYPKPKDIKCYIQSRLYKLEYHSYLPKFFKYPKPPDVKIKSVDEAYKAIMKPSKTPSS
ncbi:NADP-dependent malic enzyme-like isoform X1 [Maniola jurtina]|uniref:NADP-dependent malic enzyme-like isoform X1 n=2 Tax=Maniola jurtina TaxID=191418 RepID=UPI001E689669|nr:NADP-dependent malic enzyme-like isoform X1 [Maniola jurtina]